MNQRGQGFSVFKLLIAAIVAVFILTILLQILSIIQPPAQGNPNQEAASKIKSLLSSLGSPEKTQIVTFKNDSPLLSARTIADATGAITPNLICLDVSEDYASGNSFEAANGEIGSFNELGTIIRYTGTSNLATKLWVVCDNAEQIDDTIAAANIVSDIPDCGADSSRHGSKTVCIVSITSTN